MKRRNNVRGNDHTAPADLPERAAGNTFPVPGKYIVMKPVLLIGLLGGRNKRRILDPVWADGRDKNSLRLQFFCQCAAVTQEKCLAGSIYRQIGQRLKGSAGTDFHDMAASLAIRKDCCRKEYSSMAMDGLPAVSLSDMAVVLPMRPKPAAWIK